MLKFVDNEINAEDATVQQFVQEIVSNKKLKSQAVKAFRNLSSIQLKRYWLPAMSRFEWLTQQELSTITESMYSQLLSFPLTEENRLLYCDIMNDSRFPNTLKTSALKYLSKRHAKSDIGIWMIGCSGDMIYDDNPSALEPYYQLEAGILKDWKINSDNTNIHLISDFMWMFDSYPAHARELLALFSEIALQSQKFDVAANATAAMILRKAPNSDAALQRIKTILPADCSSVTDENQFRESFYRLIDTDSHPQVKGQHFVDEAKKWRDQLKRAKQLTEIQKTFLEVILKGYLIDKE